MEHHSSVALPERLAPWTRSVTLFGGSIWGAQLDGSSPVSGPAGTTTWLAVARVVRSPLTSTSVLHSGPPTKMTTTTTTIPGHHADFFLEAFLPLRLIKRSPQGVDGGWGWLGV